MFANELESEINYLVELGKSNISMATSWMSFLGVLTAIFVLAFVTVIIFVVTQLNRLAKQISANKRVLQTIEEHGQRLTRLAGETTEIRDQIRDQNLMAKGITDKHYGNLLEKVLKMEATPSNMNMIRNLVWTLFKPEEYESGLERLRNIFSDPGAPALMTKIERVYFEKFKETIPRRQLLTWVYEIKENKKEIDNLIMQEIQTRIKIDKSMREFWKHLPPFYPESKTSILDQLMKDLTKEKKSGE